MSVIPCKQNHQLRQQIEEYAEVLKVEAHKLGQHGLSETEFYNSGLFRGAIERIRGQFSATMRDKRDFARRVLDYMRDQGFIGSWDSAGDDNRHDYSVRLPSGKVAVIELKGCLDGNNTNIFERPPHAQEFIIWSVCTNTGSDPRKNVWSGIHTRLSADIISREQRVDGLVVWDMVCGTIGRPCPKLQDDPALSTSIEPYALPPACIYLFPGTIPSPRNNPNPKSQNIDDVQILKAFHECFKGKPNDLNYVTFEVEHRGAETLRTTRLNRDGDVVAESKPTAIQRS